ncbi:MAG: hypothetical protein ABIQ73_12395 [Acidimicrobiales bacterium]
MPNIGLDLLPRRYGRRPPGRYKVHTLGYFDVSVGFFDVEDDGSLVDALRPPPPTPLTPPQWGQRNMR